MSTLRQALAKALTEYTTNLDEVALIEAIVSRAFCQWVEAEGLVVVPREATFGMYDATSKHCEDVLKAGEPPNPFRVWSLMISAAPDALETKP